MKEVEILVEVLTPIEEALKSLSIFGQYVTKNTLDTYYVDTFRKDLQPDKTGRLRRSFRIRSRKDVNTLAYKVDHFDGDDWKYSDEYEVEVGDVSILKSILDNLGLSELVKIESKKHVFNTDDYEIVIEEVKDLGVFLEVEKLSQVSDERVAEAKLELRAFLKSLPISFGQEMNQGKPELLLRKLGRTAK